MSCRCCIVDDKNNIILELVTIGIAGFASVVVYISSGTFFINLMCNGGSILLASLGIIVLVWPEHYRLSHAVVGLAILIFIPYLLLLFSLISAIPTMSSTFMERAACVRSNQYDFIFDRKAPIDRSPLIASFVMMFTYILYMLSSAVALAVKHYGIRKKIGRQLMMCSCGSEHPSSCPTSNPNQRHEINSTNDETNIILGATILNFISQTPQMDQYQHQQLLSGKLDPA